MTYATEITTVPTRTLAVSRFHVDDSDIDEMGPRISAAFEAVMAQLEQGGVTPTGPAVASYERAGDGFDVAAGFPVDEPFEPAGAVTRLAVGGREVAHTTHLGPYDRLPDAYEALRSDVEAGGRALVDDAPMWEEYWSTPDSPPEDTRTEVFWPVAPA
jgi:effector-binding domain-containing protein